jgi:AGCS family alanine or glycine:cation symporter
MELIRTFLDLMNVILWNDWVLFSVLLTGVFFTITTRFCQYRSLTEGFKLLRSPQISTAPGALTHFQALTAALSATVGLGNIGGVALAISLGGPGAVFWMWIVGILGMAIKFTEVTLSMIYRNIENHDQPSGGPMWVLKKGLPEINIKLATLGKTLGGVFCVTLLISTITGGNMFQAWNVGEITQSYFNIPSYISGVILVTIVGLVIIGGIRRIGHVASRLVPFMVTIYLAGSIYVLWVNIAVLPETIALIFTSAFAPLEAQGAFIGGTAGAAFLFGMKRALFSNEAGQGSSPIAHSAVKTDQPVKEGVVAGLEPFIDTIVVCTFTALVVLSSGIWNRQPDIPLVNDSVFELVSEDVWVLSSTDISSEANNINDQNVFAIYQYSDIQGARLTGKTYGYVSPDQQQIIWDETIESTVAPTMLGSGIYIDYVGATLTAQAFDSALPGLGKWIVTLAAWLFAISTMISWSYYGEQGVLYLFGQSYIMTYKFIFCLLGALATFGWIESANDLDALTGLGTGLMLCANLPIMWLFSKKVTTAYAQYKRES